MMKTKMSSVLITTALTLTSSIVQGKSFEVAIKNKNFTQKALAINVGDNISFKNEDTVAHNPFSMSEIEFDLGSIASKTRKVFVFAKPGTAEVECSFHPNEKMIITVNK